MRKIRNVLWYVVFITLCVPVFAKVAIQTIRKAVGNGHKSGA